MDIASELDAAMKAFNGGRGISQAGLSRLSGVPQPTISRTLKSGSTPETTTLYKLSEALRCQLGGVSPDHKPEALSVGKTATISAIGKPKNPHIQQIVLMLENMTDVGIGIVLHCAQETIKNHQKKKQRPK